MTKAGDVAIAMVHCIIVVVNIVGNSLVCTIIKRNRDMRTPINYLLMNLAVADILYGTFIALTAILTLSLTHPTGMTGTVLCKLLTSGNVAWVGATCSIFTLVAITIERYYAIVHPFVNKGKLTKHKLKAIILGSWIFSLTLSTPLFLTSNVKSNVCQNVWPEKWMRVVDGWMWFTFVFLSSALMVVLYSRVVYTLWFKSNDNNQPTLQQSGVLKVRKRVTLMVITVTALFGICWPADAIAHAIEDNSSYIIDRVVFIVIHTMNLLNSAVNPFVYALMNQNFREKMKEMICCGGLKAVRNPLTRRPHCIEFANTIHPTHTARQCFKE